MTDPHTSDPRALAHEAMRYGSLRCPEHRHCQLCDQITSTLRTARKKAYERAAKVADEDAADAERRMEDADLSTGGVLLHVYSTATRIAAAIRKLGDDNG